MTAPTEAEFQAQVVELARLLGWRSMHVRRTIGKGSRWTTGTSVVGWPDLTLWHTGQRRVLFVELKTDVGTVTDEQTEVLESLARAGAEVAVWRPGDFEAIQATLRGTLRAIGHEHPFRPDHPRHCPDGVEVGLGMAGGAVASSEAHRG